MSRPALGDSGHAEGHRVVAGTVDRFAHVDHAPVEVGHDLDTLPGEVFLAGEQAVVVLAFADRGDQSVDQQALAGRLVEPRVEFRAGHPPRDRAQNLVIPGDRGLRATEHLAHHVIDHVVIDHVVPRPEQDRDHRRGQR